MIRIANKNARKYVVRKEEFGGSNTFARWTGDNSKNMYVVYSYGPHFPMYIFTEGHWFGNKSKYSCTTSRHQSQLRPYGELTWLSTEDMKRLVNAGSWTQFCLLKLTQ